MKITQIGNLANPSIAGAKIEPQRNIRERAIESLMKSMSSETPHNQKAQSFDDNTMVAEQNAAVAPMEASNEGSDDRQKHSNESVNELTPQAEEGALAETSAPLSEEIKLTAEAPSGEQSQQPLSSQYAILARKEKAIRLKDQQLKAKEAAIKAQEEAFKTAAASAKPSIDESKFVSKETLLNDPFSVLTSLGLTYDQLTDLALKGPRSEDVAVTNELRALREELKALKGETESTKKSFEEQQAQSRNQALSQIKREVSLLVSKDPMFETIKETNSIDDVVSLIDETFAKDGILLSVEEAAQQVEDDLVEEAMKIARINKIQQRLRAATNAPVAGTPKKTTDAPKQSQPIKTLTNAVGATRQLSARERAILAVQGKLAK